MNAYLQKCLLAAYGVAKSTGLMSTRPGRVLFEALYDIYKRRLEARSVAGLRPWVRAGSVVVDVGANIGFFTKMFAAWVGDGGRVLALEPEPANAAHLRRSLVADGLASIVDVIEAAAADTNGSRFLSLNPDHPGDHKLAERGIPVSTCRLDDLLAEREWPDVSLIKIDVQGAEEMVLAGATETLARCRPALFIEIYDAGLRQMGSSAASVLDRLHRAGYRAHRLSRDGTTGAMTQEEALAFADQAGSGYADLLFLVTGSVDAPGDERPEAGGPRERPS